jgi:hypothetical protein
MSELKVDKITPRQGTTLTLGDAGDTINFGSGVLPNFENLTVTGDLTVDTNSLKVDSTNNFVGIGTASPSVALDVVGAITATGNLTVDTNTLFVDSTNNRVGIGTASPASDLQIGTLTPLITASTKSISLGATYSNSAGSNPKLKLYDDGTNYMGLGVSANRLDFTNSNSLYDFVFYGGGSEILRFEGTGNVGIGTSSPLQPLHISYSNTSAIPTDALAEDTTGALQIYNTSDSANYAGIYLRARTSSSTNSLIGLRYNSSFNDGDMFFSIRDGSGSSNEVLTLKSSGNVGIGTSSP